MPSPMEFAKAMSRNLVICLDGTSNEPEHDATNVACLFEVAVKSDSQLVYYDPGVGTMGARGAVTPFGKAVTLCSGLIIGYGIRENLEEAYAWLMQNWRFGDRVYLFGFSRGAYTARALAGMLRTVGLLRPGLENLVPYAVKLYTRVGHANSRKRDVARAYWKLRRNFNARFGNPDFPHAFDASRKQVHFLGIWDTVKFVGWLNARGRIEQARWPFTANLDGVGLARHALAIDERRRPFSVYRIDPQAVAASKGRFVELWFAGVHSDVGGRYEDDHRLSDQAFLWMVGEARLADMMVDDSAVQRLLGAKRSQSLPNDLHLGTLHGHSWAWVLLGGWRCRRLLPGDQVHPSVITRMKATASSHAPYVVRMPDRGAEDSGDA